eukprot:1143050-Pelagomonas_calceolata.AAC.1
MQAAHTSSGIAGFLLDMRQQALIVRIVASFRVGIFKSVFCMHVRLESILKIGEEDFEPEGWTRLFTKVTRGWPTARDAG